MNAASMKVRCSRTGGAVTAPVDPVAIVRAVLSVGDAALDYARAKLAFDRIVDPASPASGTASRIERLAADALRLAGPGASPDARLAGLRRLLYVAGPWNDHRPFGYDHDDPLGQRIGSKLLATYLATRRGNCVSMPALFLILADRLGLDVAFATAPLHVFVRYRSERGTVVNIEATSGGHPSRDEWYREQMPMSGRAVASGLYLRSLSKREGVALLATTVLEHLIAQRRLPEALDVANVILRHAPRDAYTMVKAGTICGALIQSGIPGPISGPGNDPATAPRALRHARRPQPGAVRGGGGAWVGGGGVIGLQVASRRGMRGRMASDVCR